MSKFKRIVPKTVQQLEQVTVLGTHDLGAMVAKGRPAKASPGGHVEYVASRK